MSTVLEAPPIPVEKSREPLRREDVPEGQSPRSSPPERLVSLDAFRGFIMVTLAARGFGLRTFEDDPALGWLARQFEHVPWEGIVFWDLIQPAFMFMVGLAMPFSVANRLRKGASSGQVWMHVLRRTFMLLLLSQVFISIGRGELSFQLINVLSQIAFAYFLCCWIMKLPFRSQAIAAGALLAAHWALFALFPGSEGAFSKADNVGAVIDKFFGLEYSSYYVTINFMSSAVTMLFGVWAGYLMREPNSHERRMRMLAAAIAGCFALGFALQPFNPMVKRIWTASFTFASGAWVLLILLGFYWLVEVKGMKKLTFPLVVVGMNSIFIYGRHMIMHDWFDRGVGVFTESYAFLGDWGVVAQTCTVFLVMWYLCWWLYKHKIYLRV